MRLLRSSLLVGMAFSGMLCGQINLQITSPSTLPAASVGVAYKFTFQATGTTLPLSWFIPNLPPGLNFDQPTGVLSGTPTVAGSYSLAVSVVALSGPENPVAHANGTFTLGVAAPGVIRVSPTTLTFNAFSGGEAPPSQTVAVVVTTGNASSFTFTVDGGAAGTTAPWLSVLPAPGGGTPGRLIVTVDPSKVANSAVSSTGRIRVLGAGTTTPIDVSVSLVLATAKPSLSASPTSMRFNKFNPEQLLVLRNAGGGGPINFTATANGSFISSVTPSSGQTPAVLRVKVNTGVPGALRGFIRIATTAGNIDVPVSQFIPRPGPVLSVSQTGFRIQTRQGSGTSNSPFIRVLNIGDAGSSVNWTAELVSGGDFLSLSPSSGSATPASHGTFVIKTSPGAATQSAGGHYALIKVSAPGAQNSPQYVVGVLDVAPATGAVAPDPLRGGFYFAGAAGGTQPLSQLLEVGASSATPVKVAIATSVETGNWLSVSAINDSASSSQTAQFLVTASTTGLVPGKPYKGEIDVAIQNELRAVFVTLQVAPAGTTFSSANKARDAGCVATQLAVTETGMVSNFSIPAGWPATLEMQLNDDCGAPVLNGNVVASFSNGDPPITLLGDGLTPFYSATWQPGTVSSNMAVTLNAGAPGLPLVSAQLNGGVNSNATPAPSLVINGLLHNVNAVVGAPLAPGTVTQVYGTNLSASADAPSAVPLPTTFKGVQVLVGGLAAPLYYISPNQLTIQVPSELTATNEYQALIAVNGAYTLPQPVDLVPVAPGVVAFSDGALVAQHSSDFSLVDANKPAKPGEVLIIYLVGLGATSVNVPSGTAAPSDSLVNVSSPLTVTIDGQTAQTLFQGLTPGGVGLYQINLTVPGNAKAGKLPVTITQAGVPANATTLLVQP